MTTLGLPYFFEDTTGCISGPADYLDIYDRPPFLRVESSVTQRQPLGMELCIFELNSGRFARSGLRGSIRFQAGLVVQLERWLKKSTTFGSTLTRQFKGSDGMSYQWSFRKTRDHEWVCMQLGTDYLIAHYDLGETHSRTSGNALTVYERWVHLAVELLASLAVMRHIHADLSRD